MLIGSAISVPINVYALTRITMLNKNSAIIRYVIWTYAKRGRYWYLCQV